MTITRRRLVALSLYLLRSHLPTSKGRTRHPILDHFSDLAVVWVLTSLAWAASDRVCNITAPRRVTCCHHPVFVIWCFFPVSKVISSWTSGILLEASFLFGLSITAWYLAFALSAAVGMMGYCWWYAGCAGFDGWYHWWGLRETSLPFAGSSKYYYR